MAGTYMVWHGPTATRKTRELIGRRIKIAGMYLRDKIKMRSSRRQPTTGRGLKMRGLDPSRPGEYPKIVTGEFRDSITAEYNPRTLSTRVGTEISYGRDLELGTSKMAPRPWLSRGIHDYQSNLKSIVTTGRP